MHFLEWKSMDFAWDSAEVWSFGSNQHYSWTPPSHYLNQWCLVYWRIYASLSFNDLMPNQTHFYFFSNTETVYWLKFRPHEDISFSTSHSQRQPELSVPISRMHAQYFPWIICSEFVSSCVLLWWTSTNNLQVYVARTEVYISQTPVTYKTEVVDYFTLFYQRLWKPTKKPQQNLTHILWDVLPYNTAWCPYAYFAIQSISCSDFEEIVYFALCWKFLLRLLLSIYILSISSR